MDPFFQELRTKDASEFPVQASTLLEVARIPLSPGSNESTTQGVESIETPGYGQDEQSNTNNLKKRVSASQLKSSPEQRFASQLLPFLAFFVAKWGIEGGAT